MAGLFDTMNDFLISAAPNGLWSGFPSDWHGWGKSVPRNPRRENGTARIPQAKGLLGPWLGLEEGPRSWGVLG